MNSKYQQNLLAATLAFTCGLASQTTQAQDNPTFDSRLTLAPTDASSSVGGSGDGAKEQQAELAKKLQNPVASLISVPIQNNLPVAFQFGYRYYVEKPNGGPDWGLRLAITFLFPK